MRDSLPESLVLGQAFSSDCCPNCSQAGNTEGPLIHSFVYTCIHSSLTYSVSTCRSPRQCLVPKTLQVGFILLIGPSFQLWDEEWVSVRGRNAEGGQEKPGASQWLKEKAHLAGSTGERSNRFSPWQATNRDKESKRECPNLFLTFWLEDCVFPISTRLVSSYPEGGSERGGLWTRPVGERPIAEVGTSESEPDRRGTLEGMPGRRRTS